MIKDSKKLIQIQRKTQFLPQYLLQNPILWGGILRLVAWG